MTAGTAAAAMTGCITWYLHGQKAPWPAAATVPILDMINLRNTSAYLLLRA